LSNFSGFVIAVIGATSLSIIDLQHSPSLPCRLAKHAASPLSILSSAQFPGANIFSEILQR
jgi:hypothetical protein